ncbi:MAG: hypothetical protein N0C80_16985 [Candidatus Thiodiazotropha endolucinida]|nr:hypothetical protein [Candidatus Thiodiazotropha taylori]MCW4272602.1 hypothetical protein [Candidatus Thiodiazotropha endolucinida]
MPRRFIAKDKLTKINLLKTSKKAVVNLSDYQLNEDELILLGRGLTFCPTPRHSDRLLTHRDTLLFNRRLRLTHWFKDTTGTSYDPFKTPTGWTPPSGKSPTLDTYINVTTNEILKHVPKTKREPNISDTELQALKNLVQNQDIIIKPADKGGAIVIMNTRDYIKEASRQLTATHFYRRLTRNPTTRTANEINQFLNFL